MTDAAEFERIEADLAAGGAEAVCQGLAERFRRDKKFHELFDTRLAQCRERLGLPLQGTGDLERLAEPLRSQLEEGYLAACREVGELLLGEGQFRQAWTYLRPAGEKDRLRTALEAATPGDENYEELIEVALYDGVAPELGFSLVLSHHGTCNAITTFESVGHSLDRTQQQRAVAVLLHKLHADLLENVRADLAEQPAASGQAPTSGAADDTLAGLLAGVEGTFGQYCCHVDVSHLGAVVRYARLLEEPADVRLAWELTEYGRRLHADFQPPGEEPFVDMYPSHGLFLAAQLGSRVDEAVRYFRSRAEAVDAREQGTTAVEVYAVLLVRLGRHAEAMRALRLLPPGAATSRFVPSLSELAQRSGDFGTLTAICRERGDLLGFAIGRLEEARRAREK